VAAGNMSRLKTFAITSTALTLAVIYHTYTLRRQFYPTVIALTTNKVSALVLCNQALVLTLLFGKLCKRLFFGTLREAEVEHLYERSWCADTPCTFTRHRTVSPIAPVGAGTPSPRRASR